MALSAIKNGGIWVINKPIDLGRFCAKTTKNAASSINVTFNPFYKEAAPTTPAHLEIYKYHVADAFALNTTKKVWNKVEIKSLPQTIALRWGQLIATPFALIADIAKDIFMITFANMYVCMHNSKAKIYHKRAFRELQTRKAEWAKKQAQWFNRRTTRNFIMIATVASILSGAALGGCYWYGLLPTAASIKTRTAEIACNGLARLPVNMTGFLYKTFCLGLNLQSQA